MWYYIDKRERKGPVDTAAIMELVSCGKLGPDDYVWTASLEQKWKRVKDVPSLNSAPSACSSKRDTSRSEKENLPDNGFACPACNLALELGPGESRGDRVKCPACQADIVIPLAPPSAKSQAWWSFFK